MKTGPKDRQLPLSEVQMWSMWMHLWLSSIVHLTLMDTLFPSLPQVQRFVKFSRNTVLGEVRVIPSELKASQSLVLCEELQNTTKVMTLSLALAFVPTQWPGSCISIQPSLHFINEKSPPCILGGHLCDIHGSRSFLLPAHFSSRICRKTGL